MPEFTAEADIDIEPDEFVSSCSKREIKELIGALIDDGHLPGHVIGGESKTKNILDEQWDIICEKIRTNRLNLTNEEEEIIKKISERF